MASITIRLRPLGMELTLHIFYFFLCYFLYLSVYLPFLSTPLYTDTVTPAGMNEIYVSASFSSICSTVYVLAFLFLAFAVAKIDVLRKKASIGAEYWVSLFMALVLYQFVRKSFHHGTSVFFHQWNYIVSHNAIGFFELDDRFFVTWLFLEGLRLIFFCFLSWKGSARKQPTAD